MPLDRGVFQAQVWECPVPENGVSVPLASFSASTRVTCPWSTSGWVCP